MAAWRRVAQACRSSSSNERPPVEGTSVRDSLPFAHLVVGARTRPGQRLRVVGRHHRDGAPGVVGLRLGSHDRRVVGHVHRRLALRRHHDPCRREPIEHPGVDDALERRSWLTQHRCRREVLVHRLPREHPDAIAQALVLDCLVVDEQAVVVHGGQRREGGLGLQALGLEDARPLPGEEVPGAEASRTDMPSGVGLERRVGQGRHQVGEPHLVGEVEHEAARRRRGARRVAPPSRPRSGPASRDRGAARDHRGRR